MSRSVFERALAVALVCFPIFDLSVALAASVADTPKIVDRTVACGESEAVVRGVVRAVLDASREIAGYCDEQNDEQERLGRAHCPTGTCMSVQEIGGWTPPTLEVKVANSSSGGFSMGGGMSDSISVGGMGSGAGGHGFSGSAGASGSSFAARRSIARATGSSRPSLISTQPFTLSVTMRLALARNPDKLQCVNPMSQAVRDQLLGKVMDLVIAKKDLCRAN